MKTILIVEDDKYVNDLIYEVIDKSQYQVLRAFDGKVALETYKNNHVDLVLLDLMLPIISGEEILSSIAGKCKVIVLTAKASKYDKIKNLINGADDYITKPFDNDELLARIEVQLRNAITPKSDEINCAGISINNSTHKVFCNNNEVLLTPIEFKILYLLMSNKNQVFSKEKILENIFEDNSYAYEDSVKVHICNIRTKLQKYSDFPYISTIWGIGFKFNDHESKS